MPMTLNDNLLANVAFIADEVSPLPAQLRSESMKLTEPKMQPVAYSTILASTLSEHQIAARNPLFNRQSVTGIESARSSLDQSVLEPSDESVDCNEDDNGSER